jgi:hypothetical protein
VGILRRLRRLAVLSAIAGAVAAYRQRAMTESENRLLSQPPRDDRRNS